MNRMAARSPPRAVVTIGPWPGQLCTRLVSAVNAAADADGTVGTRMASTAASVAAWSTLAGSTPSSDATRLKP